MLFAVYKIFATASAYQVIKEAVDEKTGQG
jgi:hypothetical protein